MNDYIELYSKLSKKWIFPCRLFIPSSFGKTALDGSINNEFYIDFISKVLIKYQTIHFKGYLVINLEKDNGYLIPSIRLIKSDEPSTFTCNGILECNGKFISWRNHGASPLQAILCDYKDIPRILYREILPQFPCFKGNMEKVAKDIIDKAKKSMLYAQSVRQITLPSRDCFIK